MIFQSRKFLLRAFNPCPQTSPALIHSPVPLYSSRGGGLPPLQRRSSGSAPTPHRRRSLHPRRRRRPSPLLGLWIRAAVAGSCTACPSPAAVGCGSRPLDAHTCMKQRHFPGGFGRDVRCARLVLPSGGGIGIDPTARPRSVISGGCVFSSTAAALQGAQGPAEAQRRGEKPASPWARIGGLPLAWIAALVADLSRVAVSFSLDGDRNCFLGTLVFFPLADYTTIKHQITTSSRQYLILLFLSLITIGKHQITTNRTMCCIATPSKLLFGNIFFLLPITTVKHEITTNKKVFWKQITTNKIMCHTIEIAFVSICFSGIILWFRSLVQVVWERVLQLQQ